MRNRFLGELSLDFSRRNAIIKKMSVKAENIIWSCIEVVITGRTRNALALRGTWVRIPPTPFVYLPCRYHYNDK